MKSNNIVKNIFIFGVCFVLFFIININFSLADSLSDAGAAAGYTSGGSSVPLKPQLVIASIIKTALGFLGIIFTSLIIYAGFNWMTAQGDSEKITKAKDILKNAIIGLSLVLMSYAIAEMIINVLVDAGK